MAYTTPKTCAVTSIVLTARGAEVNHTCWTTDAGSRDTRNLRNIRTVNFRGAHVTSPGRVGFVVSPAKARCRTQGNELSCHLVGDTASLKSLAGLRRRRRRTR